MAGIGRDDQGERPFQGGAQPVSEHPPEIPGPGRIVMQTVVIIVAILAVLAGLAWFLIPLAAR